MYKVLKLFKSIGRQTCWPCRFYYLKSEVYGHKLKFQRQSPDDKRIVVENRTKNSELCKLVNSFREKGHMCATYDPLHLQSTRVVPELNPELYDIQINDSPLDLTGILEVDHKHCNSVQDVVQILPKLYCGNLSAEFFHIPDCEEKQWFASKFEQIQMQNISNEDKFCAAKLMLKSQAFDNFLGNKFSTVKRYGGEGAESAMVFYNHLFKSAAQENICDIVIGIAHRGRLNLLACLMNFPPVTMFRKMNGYSEFPSGLKTTGDVLSHLSGCTDLEYSGKSVHVTMLSNSSHLEAVNPVTCGKARARMQSKHKGDYKGGSEVENNHEILCLQIHGDAAFAAQGVVYETFALANAPHFSVGGSVHLIINNQIGFTTEQSHARSSEYSSCIGKVNNCPILRVNAESPEDVIRACELALLYRQKYGKDVIVDLICYRRWGHNEVDEPAITQPLMYEVIRNKTSIPDSYKSSLITDGVCTEEDLNEDLQHWNSVLTKNLNQVESHTPKLERFEGQWSKMTHPSSNTSSWDTGVDLSTLKYVGAKSVSIPSDMTVHPSLVKSHIERRVQKLEDGINIDWATAEALAIGSLMYQGYNVRISGQDVGRGTFSHRHCMIVDQNTDHVYIPLNNISPEQTGFLEVCNSILSEEAVLGFEYGVSIENPNILPIWEAQFGDFFNGAQIIIDAFISSGEDKWLYQSSLTMLLPHGMDGTGPEHSSCRLERFLQLTDSKEDSLDGDNVNMEVVFPTTPAQYFHLLRRQLIRNYRKPLIVVGPKTLLRLPAAVSHLGDMAPQTFYKPILSDETLLDPSKVTKLVFVSGKHYYTLKKERDDFAHFHVALIRLESLCPFPAEEIRKEIAKFPNAKDFIWSQEEHRNQGAWNFVQTRFEHVVGLKLGYTGREVKSTPATGIANIHKTEAQHIIQKTLHI